MNHLEIAIKNGKKSKHPKMFHVAIVIKGGKILSIAANSERKHAEDNAIRRMKKPWKCKIISLRVNKQNDLRMARPCDRCMKLIAKSGISTVFYSNQEGEIIKEKI